jgi:hypothetical protein
VGIKAYFDCSGQNDSKILTVGGHLSWDKTCEEIESEWNAALVEQGYCEPDGGPGVFHLADFGTPFCKYGTEKWDIQTKRIPFLKRLAGVINRKDNQIVSFSVETSRYKEFLESSPNPPIWGPEYFTGCALMTLILVETQLDQVGFSKEYVAYVYENGDRQHEMHKAFEEYVAGHPELEDLRRLAFSPKELPLLQGADLTAGKVNEVLGRAQEKLGFLDNGQRLTPVSNFEKYYSFDGTSEALLKEVAYHQCYVANKSHFQEADRKLVATVRRNPKILERRLKRKLPKIS